MCFASSTLLLTGSDDGSVAAWAFDAMLADADRQMQATPATESVTIELDVKPQFQLFLPSHTVGGRPEVNAIAVDCARNRLFVGGGDHVVHNYDLQTQQAAESLRGHDDYVHCLTLQPASGAPVSGSEDGTVRLWDVRSGATNATYALPTSATTSDNAKRAKRSRAYIGCVALSADGHWLAAGGGANAAGLWHTPSQQLVSVLPHASAVGALRFLHAGDVSSVARGRGRDVAQSSNVLGNAACGGGALVSGDLGSGTLAHWNLDGSQSMRVSTHAASVYALALNEPAQYRMMASAGTSHRVDVFFGAYSKRAFSVSL